MCGIEFTERELNHFCLEEDKDVTNYCYPKANPEKVISYVLILFFSFFLKVK